MRGHRREERENKSGPIGATFAAKFVPCPLFAWFPNTERKKIIHI